MSQNNHSTSTRCKEPDMFKDTVCTKCWVTMIWETCIKMPIEIIYTHTHKLRGYIIICKSIWCDQVFWETFRPEGRTARSWEAQHKLTGSSTSGSSSHHIELIIWHEIQVIWIYRKCVFFWSNFYFISFHLICWFSFNSSKMSICLQMHVFQKMHHSFHNQHKNWSDLFKLLKLFGMNHLWDFVCLFGK